MFNQLLSFILLFALISYEYPVNGQMMSDLMPKKARTEADYQQRTLKEIGLVTTESVSDRTLKIEDGAVVTSNLLPSQVRVTYTGLIRPLRDRQRQVLLRWARRYAGAMETYTQPYQNEMLFTEYGVEYRLAVKSKDIPRFQQSLQSGKPVKLNVIRMGGVQTKNGWDWLLLVESFRRA